MDWRVGGYRIGPSLEHVGDSSGHLPMRYKLEEVVVRTSTPSGDRQGGGKDLEEDKPPSCMGRWKVPDSPGTEVDRKGRSRKADCCWQDGTVAGDSRGHKEVGSTSDRYDVLLLGTRSRALGPSAEPCDLLVRWST